MPAISKNLLMDLIERVDPDATASLAGDSLAVVGSNGEADIISVPGEVPWNVASRFLEKFLKNPSRVGGVVQNYFLGIVNPSPEG